MSFKALLYAYVLGGFTLVPLVVAAFLAWTLYTSVPIGDPDPTKLTRAQLSAQSATDEPSAPPGANDQPKARKGWLTVRRTFEEKETDASYVNLMRSFLDSRSKDPKRSRPKDMWYVVFKGNVLYLYEDEAMTECEAAIHIAAHEVVVYPEGLLDGELFTKRNAICLKPRVPPPEKEMHSVTKEMSLEGEDVDKRVNAMEISEKKKQKEKDKLGELERKKEAAKEEALDPSTPWFIFVRSCVEMEDWYHALVHASSSPAHTPTLDPLLPIFRPADMLRLVSTLDEQPDIIPMRWLNALIGRLFFSFYRTDRLESYIIGRLMKKLSKVKMPSLLQNVIVTNVSVGNAAPTFSKPMLKELTQEGDAALEVRLTYKGEVRITVEATAIISLGQRFKSYTVKLVLACVLRELEGNLLVKVKRPPSNRLWYAFTQPPTMVLDVEPVVSDRQIKWSMILSTIESKLKEIIYESVVMPNMDDIAFFESSQYEHRGGIWADARRKDQSESDAPTPSTEEPTSPPLPATDTSEVHKSYSADEVTASRPADPEVMHMPRAETIATSEASDSTAPKQKTWLSKARSDVNSTDSVSGSLDPDDETSNTGRGMSSLADNITAWRSTSVPPDSNSVTSTDSAFSDVPQSTETLNAFPSKEWLSPSSLPPSVRRSSAQHSYPSSRTRSMSSTADFQSSSGASSPNASIPTHGSALNSNTNTPASPTSFLSTLKSKAADKQALSNSAKEAMRKWGVNWSGFKRDHTGSNGSVDETIDAGDHHHGNNVSSSSSRSKRGNYADIRAAVVGRKDRERTTSLEYPEEHMPSPPISIPGRSGGEEKGDRISTSQSTLSTPSKDGTSPPLPSAGLLPQQSPYKPSMLRGESPKVAASTPRLITEVQPPGLSRSSSADTPQVPEGSTSSPRPPSPSGQPAPIHKQPSQAASMTIPGIHARHRGEVMSLGYAPPTPPPQPIETKLKAPAIQSMYRLFKSPTLSGQQQPQQESSLQPVSRTTSNEPAATETHSDVTPLSLSSADPVIASPQLPHASKPIPPPLPPRSLSVTATPVSTTTRRTPEPPLVPAKTLPTPSSASEALKVIVSKDESKRQSLELTGGRVSMSSRRASLGAKRLSGHNFDDVLADSAQDQQQNAEPSKAASGDLGVNDDSTSGREQIDARTPNLPPPLPPRKGQTVNA